jgi:hypothetical protein
MTTSGNTSSRFNLMQRTIQAVFGTREFAVVALVGFCTLVEICILIATQRYEALTAPPGTVLFWGMSAAGMVIFFAEVLKLPVAWVSGVVSGKRMLVLNVVTAGLCLLTAMTIKDLVIWEWDAALKPAREIRDQAKAVETEVDALERSRMELTQNSKVANELRQAKIDGLKKLLDDQVRRRNEDQTVFRERLTSLNRNLLDPSTQNQIVALERVRDSTAVTFKTDLENLQKQLDALDAREQERSQTERTDAKQTFEKTAEQRETRRKEYELARQDVITRRDADIKALGDDGMFKGVGPERVRLRDEADKELKRLESEYKTDIAALSGVKSGVIPTDATGDIVILRQQIASKQKDRDQKLEAIESDIRTLYQRVAKDKLSASGEFERQARDIEREMTSKIGAHEVKIREYEDQLSAITAESKALTLSTPQQIEAKVQEITAQLPALKKRADALRAESNRLAKDTNAFRAANGVVRWVLPDAPIERLEEVAYGVFPLLIALLVASLPAVLLEISVYCIRPEVRRAERPRPSLLARLSRGRRVLRDLRARTQERMRAADAALRECTLVKEKLILEHTNRSTTLDQELEQKIAGAVADLQSKTEQLDNALKESQAKEAKLAVDLTAVTEKFVKAAEDIRALTKQVATLDAATYRSR